MWNLVSHVMGGREIDDDGEEGAEKNAEHKNENSVIIASHHVNIQNCEPHHQVHSRSANHCDTNSLSFSGCHGFY